MAPISAPICPRNWTLGTRRRYRERLGFPWTHHCLLMISLHQVCMRDLSRGCCTFWLIWVVVQYREWILTAAQFFALSMFAQSRDASFQHFQVRDCHRQILATIEMIYFCQTLGTSIGGCADCLKMHSIPCGTGINKLAVTGYGSLTSGL